VGVVAGFETVGLFVPNVSTTCRPLSAAVGERLHMQVVVSEALAVGLCRSALEAVEPGRRHRR